MKGSSRKTLFRRCAHCGRKFPVDPRVGRLHQFCSNPECVHASHLKSDRKWRRGPKGRDYFKGWENAHHVRQWRRLHPEYWQTGRRPTGLPADVSLASMQHALALQDSIDAHFALLIGLIADRSNLALQDTIALEIRRLILLGHGIISKSKRPESPDGQPRPRPLKRVGKA